MMSAAATKTKPRVMSRGGIIACTVLTLLTPVGLLLIHLARGNAEEVEHLRQAGAVSASLGKRILRTETAGMLGVGIVLYQFDELG